jgi:hypothetical protein
MTASKYRRVCPISTVECCFATIGKQACLPPRRFPTLQRCQLLLVKTSKQKWLVTKGTAFLPPARNLEAQMRRGTARFHVRQNVTVTGPPVDTTPKKKAQDSFVLQPTIGNQDAAAKRLLNSLNSLGEISSLLFPFTVHNTPSLS